VANQVRPNLTFGQTIYSAATGQGGGAVFWGYELAWSRPLSDRVSLTLDGFFGGGGGANVTYGDGRMARVGVGLSTFISPSVTLDATLSQVEITGTSISGPLWSLGITYHPEKDTRGNQEEPRLRTVSSRASRIYPTDHLNRQGLTQPNISLIGAEASFLSFAPDREVYFAADGAVGGAQGYMQVFGGLRQRIQSGAVQAYGDLALGFGGGGQVATGGGVLLSASAGVSVPAAPLFDIEFSVGRIVAPDGDFGGTHGMVRLTRAFQKTREQSTRPQKWRLSSGFTLQRPNDSFRQAGNPYTAWPVMQESSIDMLLGENVYITGNGQTVVDGDAGGYALGLLGMGYQFPLHEDWMLSFEGHIGAAGGGGVETRGGIVGSLRAELDYRLTDRWGLSLGVGQIRTLKGGGMAPPFVHIGVKTPFRTK